MSFLKKQPREFLPELRKVVNRNTKHYASDFEKDEIIFRAAARDAAKGKAKTFLWFSRDSGTLCIEDKDALLKDSPAYITYRYYSKMEETEEKSIKAFEVTVTGMDDKENPIGFVRPVNYFEECKNLGKYAVPAKIKKWYRVNGTYFESLRDVNKAFPQLFCIADIIKEFLPEDETALEQAMLARKVG